MIISWEKIRHRHPKEEWKELLQKLDSSVEIGSGSSHVFSNLGSLRRKSSWDLGGSSYILRYY
ncbi:hypothetical protein AB3N59_03965 [Leptospira sp. WS92.C1]